MRPLAKNKRIVIGATDMSNYYSMVLKFVVDNMISVYDMDLYLRYAMDILRLVKIADNRLFLLDLPEKN